MKRGKRSRGPVVQGRVRDVARGGDGVLETSEGLVFVPGVLPGEQVRARLGDKRRGARHGKLVEVVTPAAERVTPPCPHFGRCGGCPLMHASASAQRQLKRSWLEQAVASAGQPVPQVQFETADPALGYRRRARFAWARKGGRVLLGLRRPRSREVVDLDGCPVLEPALALALSGLRRHLQPVLQGQGEIDFARGEDAAPAVVLRSGEVQPPEVYAACAAWAEQGELAGLALYAGGVSAPARWGDPTEWTTGADGAPLRGTVGGFSQAHAGVNAQLVRRVAELADTRDARVLELYAGHGNLSVLLARGARRYAAVEQEPEAVEACRANLAARQLSAEVSCAPVEAHLQKLSSGPVDVVVLDPPRTGAPGVLTTLLPRRPKRVVYVSCDTATLGRDLQELTAHGYRVDRAVGFDMFPQTAELESVVRLVH